jgi:enoyl-CoA hydratase/carnithine racemase
MSMQTAADPRIKYQVTDRVAYVTIDRPEAKNALCKAMYATIRRLCLEADADPDVDVFVVRGAGGNFSAGGDLKEMLDTLEGPTPTAILDYEDYLPFDQVRNMRKPTVACVEGICMGGGLTLSLMCDVTVASDRARFAIPEAKVGIVDGHLPRLLRHIVPPARLRKWMFTGTVFSAAEAHDAGLLSVVASPDELDAALQKMVGELKASSREAIAALKPILNEAKPLSTMTDAFLTLLQPHVLARLQQFGRK